MITINKERNTEFLIRLVDSSEYKDFYLGFKEYSYDASNKEFYFGTKEEMDHDEIMELFARIVKTMEAKKIDSVSIDVCGLKHNDLYEVVSGLVLSSYKLKEKDMYPIDITLITKEGNEDISEYICLATNINLAKKLSNMPANECTPNGFIQEAKIAFEELENVTMEVIDDNDVLNMGMGGLYGVGRGSKNRPQMLVINYTPLKDQEIFGLVGKGVTFDTGGYCLKPAGSMADMKGDMGGASSVLAILKTAVEQKIQRNLVAVIPLCENRISDDSILPGDIISMYDGTTVEVLNTDAEGRLILADAVSYAIKDKGVTGVLDMATLTGAAVAAFGNTITPILTNSKELWNDLEGAMNVTSEKFISMPYYKEHYKMIQSKMADIKNLGGKSCGVVTAGLFIEHFAKSVPWMHFDIAGTHAVDAPLYEYQQTGTVGGAIASVYYMLKK